MNGLEHIRGAFEAASSAGRAALMPYFTLGYPTPQASAEVVEAVARSGADLIELGVPFSDPLADGPTIQHSTQTALEQGITVRGCLEIVARLRQRGVRQPLLLMGYYNPILAYGVAAFVADAARAGADGFIVPDLPIEEANDLDAACRQHGCALVYLLAPTSTTERIQRVAARSSGFIYLVSIAGVTGARQALPAHLQEFIHRVRQHTRLPLAVGFGISSANQTAAVGRLADGVIIGSALIKTVETSTDPAGAAEAFVAKMSAALSLPSPLPEQTKNGL